MIGMKLNTEDRLDSRPRIYSWRGSFFKSFFSSLSLSLSLCSTITFFSHEESSRIRGKRCFHFAIDSLDIDCLLSGIGLSIVHGEGSSTWDIPLNAFPCVRFLRSKSKKFLYNVWKGILFLFYFILSLFVSLCSFGIVEINIFVTEWYFICATKNYKSQRFGFVIIKMIAIRKIILEKI